MPKSAEAFARKYRRELKDIGPREPHIRYNVEMSEEYCGEDKMAIYNFLIIDTSQRRKDIFELIRNELIRNGLPLEIAQKRKGMSVGNRELAADFYSILSPFSFSSNAFAGLNVNLVRDPNLRERESRFHSLDDYVDRLLS